MPAFNTIDTRAFPLVVLTFTGEKATDENFSEYLRGMERLYDREQSFVFIFDATEATIPGLKFQKRQADWLRANEAMIRQYCLGTAYVIPNSVIRAVLRGIFSLQSQPVPYTVVGALSSARLWATERLER